MAYRKRLTSPKPRGPERSFGSEGEDRHEWDLELLKRLKAITATVTYREMGEATGVHPETVRRYVTDGRPSAFFIAGLCRMLNVPPSWLLFGVIDTPGCRVGEPGPKRHRPLADGIREAKHNFPGMSGYGRAQPLHPSDPAPPTSGPPAL